MKTSLNGLPAERGVSSKTSECLGGGGGALEGKEALQGVPAVPREWLVVSNYFRGVFMSISHMPFCFRNTKQLEIGFQTL